MVGIAPRSNILRRSRAALMAGALALSSCGDAQDSDPIGVSVMGTRAELVEPLRLSGRPAADVVLSATAQGLVAFDAQGDIVPALAERWIVEEDGQSYIFRLGQATWPNGEMVKAQDVVPLLRARARTMRRVTGMLQPEIRAMTDLVIEIRLRTPQPTFLQLLAHPAMAIARPQGGTGPYRKTRTKTALILSPVPDPMMMLAGAEEAEVPPEATRIVEAVRPSQAIVRFRSGRTQLVLGGQFQHLPLIEVAGIRPQVVRADPVSGLFGLGVSAQSTALNTTELREAISMAIDRDRIASLLKVANWQVRDTILPAQFDLSRPASAPRWRDTPLTDRRRFAADVVSRQLGQTARPVIRIALPDGPGATLMFRAIAADLAAIGLQSRRVSMDAASDLFLIDEVAPHDSAAWYLARIGCGNGVACNPEADARLAQALSGEDNSLMTDQIGEAEVLALAHGGFIPIGTPIRWALVAPRLTGFRPSARGRHPLNDLVLPPR